MGRRVLTTYEYRCDNFTNDNTARELANKPCFVTLRFEVDHDHSADQIAQDKYYWRKSDRGWNCPNGHFHQYPGSITKEEIRAVMAALQ